MSGRHGKKAQKTPLYARKTTQLPSSLKDELVSLGKIAAPKGKKQNLDPTTAAGRKQLRKQDRKEKGGHSQGLSHVAPSSHGIDKSNGKRTAPQEDRKGKKRQRVDEEDYDDGIQPPKASSSKKSPDETKTQNKTPLQKLLDKNAGSRSGGKTVQRARPAASGSASTIEEQEDAEIAWLEAQLGLGKNSKSRKEFEEDGLDGRFCLFM